MAYRLKACNCDPLSKQLLTKYQIFKKKNQTNKQKQKTAHKISHFLKNHNFLNITGTFLSI